MTDKSNQPALKPCPFCGGVAILFQAGKSGRNIYYCVECAECSIGQDEAVPKEKAIAAWNQRTQLLENIEQLPNDPLTTDELRGMVGEPVWNEEYMEYALIGESDEHGDMRLVGNDGSIYYIDIGVSLYRRKPEGGE